MKKIYSDFNTEKRTNAADSSEENFIKLMITSIYGKIMENLRKRINVRLANNEKDFFHYIPANQLKLLIKSLIKTMLLFMKLSQF